MRRRTTRKPAGESDALLIGIDTGGTFTDIVYRHGERRGVYKTMSTPDDPAAAVLAALRLLFPARRADRITYGTTVATNAMLERRGAAAAMLLTAGFEDTLEIGRQARPDLYALEPVRPEPLVPSALCIGVRERLRHDGSVATALDDAEIERVVRAIRSARVESIGICLLHSHVQPRHERAIGRALRRLGLPVTLSSNLSPLRGEYERASTTAANAYVRPLVADHLQSLARRARAGTLRVMQSNGGAIGVALACREPVRTMLSGPAGGVAAAAEVAAAVGFDRAISFDMGGTSTDVALIDGVAARRATTDIGGVPIRVASLDVHSVGAGGGSIAHVDAGGALRVGPESAGADPGPACYGRGHAPTVTDANVVLGRLRPEAFLGGHMRLDVDRASRVMGHLAREMHCPSAAAAAEGVIRVVQNSMERAIRFITVERGQDPRTCAMVAFGGAAGLHACGLADELGVTSIVVPADAGVLSARGMLGAALVHDVARTFVALNPTPTDLGPVITRAGAQARRALRARGFGTGKIVTEAFVHMRYLGEGSTLEIPYGAAIAERFRREHARLFHSVERGRTIECTAVRASATAQVHDAAAPGAPRRRTTVRPRPSARPRNVEVWLGGKLRRIPCFERASLGATVLIGGPALLTEYSSTLWIAPGWTLRSATRDHLVLER